MVGQLRHMFFVYPGKNVSWLINVKKKFRNRGGREGAFDAMKNLEKDGLGKLVLKTSKGSIQVGSWTTYICIA